MHELIDSSTHLTHKTCIIKVYLASINSSNLYFLQQCHECYGGGYKQCQKCAGRGWVSMTTKV